MTKDTKHDRGRFRAVLFDVDGTIALTEDRNQKIVAMLIRKYGAEMSHEEQESLRGQPERVIWAHLAPRFPAFAQAISAQDFERESRAAAMKSEFHVAARPGMAQSIMRFKKQGLRVAAVSNSPRYVVEHNLRQAGCLHLMEFLVCEDDVLKAGRAVKPAPDPYLMAAEQMGVAPEYCIVVEDSLTGVKSGLAAGATVIHLIDEGADSAASTAHIKTRNSDEYTRACRDLVPPARKEKSRKRKPSGPALP